MNHVSGSAQLNNLLARMNQEGEFPISVLTDQQGLAIASAANAGMDPDRQSAVVALIQKAATQVGKQLGMASADEISLYDINGQRLVCRPFSVNKFELVLAVIVPDRNGSYRRVTNNAIHEIRHTWNIFWK